MSLSPSRAFLSYHLISLFLLSETKRIFFTLLWFFISIPSSNQAFPLFTLSHHNFSRKKKEKAKREKKGKENKNISSFRCKLKWILFQALCQSILFPWTTTFYPFLFTSPAFLLRPFFVVYILFSSRKNIHCLLNSHSHSLHLLIKFQLC